MSNVVPMRARAPWTETEDGKLLAQWKWLRTLNSDPAVSSPGKHVAFYLIERFDEAKGYAFPGYASIMKANGIGRKGAMSAIASLEENGWFQVRRSHNGSNGTGGPRSVNHYYPVWGRAAEKGTVSASDQSSQDTAPSPHRTLPFAQTNCAKQSFEGTGQSPKRTGQSLDGHWGSPPQGTGAVSERGLDSTYSTHSAHNPTHDPACGRASAPHTTGSASRGTGIVIHADWHPGDVAWDLVLEDEGEAATEEARIAFVERYHGQRLGNPVREWGDFCREWFGVGF